MARLRSMRLRGFKTFARPTELIFETGVTVIIGPNGSGKSNLADAVLWVLGEQSPSSLRGRNMQDVIFAGPDGRRASAAAEVSLVFDNSTGALPVAAQEVELTRRLEREGGSEYRLNGTACRLLDVQDLVGALGLGREMHSVISQGKVEALLNSTPEARRAMVEEACGLGRLKKRRERAQAKLDRTRQNLLRVADIEAEVKAALRPLRQQALAAERYAQVKEEWAQAKARLLLHGLVAAETALHQARAEAASLEARRRELERSLEALGRERAASEEALSAALARRERATEAAHRVRSQAEQLESRAGMLRQRLVRLTGELDRAARRAELARAEALDLETRLQAAEAESSDRLRLERVVGWHASLREALEQRLPAYRTAVAAEEDLRDLVFELEAARSRLGQDRDFLHRELEGRRRLEAELQAVAVEAERRVGELKQEAARLTDEAEAAEKAVLEAKATLQAAVVDLENARSAESVAERAMTSLREEVAGLEARRRVVADLARRREGIPAAARLLLEEDAGRSLVIEVLRVQPGYEKALVAALGPLAQAVILSSHADLPAVLAGEGPVEVLCLDREGEHRASPAEAPQQTKDLWDVVSGPERVIGALRGLLPPTVVVLDRDHLTAGDVETSRRGYRVVSRQGEVATAGIHVARCHQEPSEALLRWRRELAELEAELEKQRGEQEAAFAASAQAKRRREEAESRARAAGQALEGAEQALRTVSNERDLLERRIEEAAARCLEARERLERERALRERLLGDLRELEATWAARESELEQTRADLRAHQARVEELRLAVGRLEAKRAQANLAEVKLRERCRAQQAERTRLVEQRAVLLEEAENWDRRALHYQRLLPVIEGLLETTSLLAGKARTHGERLGLELAEAQRGIQDRADALRDWGGLETGLRREMEEISGLLGRLQVELARQEDRRLLYESELSDLRRRHLSPRAVGPEDVRGEDEAALAAAVERAERRLERIGPVNPLAEAECKELEQRTAFLAEQRRDLETSSAELERVIKELDEHIESTFAEMFAAVKEHFGAVIAAVFPGAKGSLTLIETRADNGQDGQGSRQESDDVGGEYPGGVGLLAESSGRRSQGIALEIKLPNKAPRSLSLLSGGEKAMTAIAFLFSLFLARPCPFYILDEVDASLDDINIRRFLSLVRRHKDRTQFIIITHQRQTMEVADTLYGVTLDRDGTSRLLSRRLVAAKGA
jgi:chromosome segregation protein